MADRINGISSVRTTSMRIEPVRGYTKKEKREKLKEIEKAEEERETLRASLANSNPNHLTFAELLDQAIQNNKTKDDDIGYILDIKTKG